MSNQNAVYKEVFDTFDVDQNGYLSCSELGKCLKALGITDSSGAKLSSSSIKFLIQCADKDANGKMSYDEFQSMVTVQSKSSIEELKHFREVFKSFDLDNSGTISVSEMRNCMEKLGEPMTDDECRELISAADKDADGTMDFFEFVLMIKTEPVDPTNDEESLRETFQMFDTNGDGTIDKGELKKILETLDENPTDEQIDAMFQEADVDGNGRITFEEFRKVLDS